MSDQETEFRAFYRDSRIKEQLRFYRSRCGEYREAHDQAARVRNWLLVLSALAGIIGEFASGSSRALAGVAAAVLAALAGAVTAFEELIGFSQVGKLYADAEYNLTQAAIDWDDKSLPADTAAQIDRIEGILRLETSQWGQLTVEKATQPPDAGTSGTAASA